MTDVYLNGIINNNKPNTNAIVVANKLIPKLKNWAGSVLKTIEYSGSYAKGTAVRGSSDIDLFISLKNNGQPIKEIYESLFNAFSELNPKKQNVSIKIIMDSVSIDLVPGRVLEGYQYPCNLWKNRANTWIQTNIHEQINYVKNSNRTNEIKLIKIWRNKHNLSAPSFFLELLTIEALKGCLDNLDTNMQKVFDFINTRVDNVRLIDPANTNNNVSDDLYDYEKKALKSKAKEAIDAKDWGPVF